jgi:Sec-independent protein translocase protein TatA
MSDVLAALLVILVIVLIWRGPKTLPGLGAALGRTIRDVRREASKMRSPSDDDAPPGGA